MNAGAVVLTALLSSATTAAAMYALWRVVLMPDLQRRARELSDEATAAAVAELTAAGEAMLPKARLAIRDGIRDAVLIPPADRIGQTARGVTSAGVSVVETSLRRVFGVAGAWPGPQRPDPEAYGTDPAAPEP